MKKRVLYAACFGVISAFGLVWPAAAQVQHVMQIVGEDGLTSRTVAWLDDRAGTCPVFHIKRRVIHMKKRLPSYGESARPFMPKERKERGNPMQSD